MSVGHLSEIVEVVVTAPLFETDSSEREHIITGERDLDDGRDTGDAVRAKGILPFTGRPATEGEIAYAEFAERTRHIVVSSTLPAVSWKNTRIVAISRKFAG